MPLVSSGSVLIKTVYSCISAGTEISGVTSSGKSLIRRALEQPENVMKALNLVRSDGVVRTYKKLMGKLDRSTPTGYSLAGIAIAVGENVNDIDPGDHVAAAGAGIANHAEYVDVPRNLVMRIPEGLGFDLASSVTLGGIAMQGIRRANPAIGEYVVVFGTGILGQIAIQLLVASGARVIAIDLDRKRLELAQDMGAEIGFSPVDIDPVTSVKHYTGGYGADVVLFCANTSNSQTLSDAFAMCRKKGRLVMVGVWGSELKREDIYEKELDFLISTAYGPGRYDENYERRSLDYPYAYVRWTENRNMEEYLRLLADEKINIKPLIQSIYTIGRVEEAFRLLQEPDRPLIVLLDYGQELPKDFKVLTKEPNLLFNDRVSPSIAGKKIRVGLIGAGDFAVGMHLPNLQKLNNIYEIRAICSRTGSKAQAIADQFDAKYATTNYGEIIEDSDIDLTMICTRHNLHGRMVLESLKAGKHTFVEKPLCISQQELDQIKAFYGLKPKNRKTEYLQPSLTVGFNRRFSRFAREVKDQLKRRINPLILHYRMNAGYIPLEHWVHTDEGGGRIIGEACHIIDLFSYFVATRVKSYAAADLTPTTDSLSRTDNKSIVLKYEDGSIGTLNYFAVGSKEMSKEYLEVHFDEKSIIVDDYKLLTGYGVNIPEIKTNIPEKGHFEELEELAKHLIGEKDDWLIPLDELLQTTEISFHLT